MNSVVFMPRIMPHCGGGGDFSDLPVVLLTLVIVGVPNCQLLFWDFCKKDRIFYSISQFSNGFSYTPIYWDNIKPTFDNSFLGCLGGVIGFILVVTALLIGLVAGVYCLITML